MLHLPCVLVCATCLLGDAPVGWLTCAGRGAAAEPWVPQPGDIILFDDHKLYWLILYHVVGSAPPTHSAMVVRLPNGRLAMLESGPDDGKLVGPYVTLLDLESRMHTFKGMLWVRRVRQPLCPEGCARLTNFALSQLGRRYATGRLLLQGTPFRVRNAVTRRLFGKTYQDRVGWLCSELVVAAGTAAGLFDPKRHPANAMYPLDMMEDKRFDISGTWHKAAVWNGEPPK